MEDSGLEQLLNVASEAQVTLGCGAGDQGPGQRNDTGSYMCKATLRKQGLEYSLEDFIFPELVKLMNPQLSWRLRIPKNGSFEEVSPMDLTEMIIIMLWCSQASSKERWGTGSHWESGSALNDLTSAFTSLQGGISPLYE